MTDRETWLSTIRSNPSDWQTMLVFADWLEEEGDLLAAEQWRWMSVCEGSYCELYGSILGLVQHWPRKNAPSAFAPYEKRFAAENNIRCMPTYPLTIEDVQAYLEAAQ